MKPCSSPQSHPVSFTSRQFRSDLLGNERRVWLQQPASIASPGVLCILLDGEFYVERMDAPSVFRELEATGRVPPIAVAYLSHINSTTRWIESFCNRQFSLCVEEKLIPWAMSECGIADRVPILLGGLSLTGLAAAHAALHSANVTGVLCQSASFWWNNCWLVQDVGRQKRASLRFRISCGEMETTDYVKHGPDLIQRTSQIASNRAMRDALLNAGHAVSYEEFAGGHDMASWKADLPTSIRALLD